MARINQKTFKEALKNSGGNQARIALKLEVTRQAVGLYLKKNPKMRELLEQEAEMIIDIAEDNVNTDIMVHRDVDSSKWKLLNSRRGKDRGYGAKNEIEHSGKVFEVKITEVESASSTSELGVEQKTETSVDGPSG